MKTIGDLVKKCKEEGDGYAIELDITRVVTEGGFLCPRLSELKKLPQDMDIQKYVDENSHIIVWTDEPSSEEVEFDIVL